MVFNSVDFLLFFPIVVIIYYIVPAKIKYIWLLIASYYFYISCDIRFLAYLLPLTLLTYCMGVCVALQRGGETKYGNIVAYLLTVIAVFTILVVLGILKYADFFVININRVVSRFGFTVKKPEWNLILPLGFSFYSLQAIGYLFDVYRKKICAERNLLKLALFLSFFPIVLSGPIERADHFLKQIHNSIKFDVQNIRKGMVTFAWGLYLKLVIADRLAVAVNSVISDYRSNYMKGCEIAVATILFGIEIYCDFNGYSQMARGSARILGIDLINNFRAPYLAPNIKEFWRRWHVSLTSWFTDYLYIPLGGNRKGIMRKYVNIVIVFGLSGLWHGAAMNFVVWGLLNGMYLIIYDMCSRHNRGMREKKELFGDKVVKRFVTFLAVDFAWFFFMMPDLKEALSALWYAATNFNIPWIFSGSIFSMISGKWELFILMSSILLVFIVDYVEYYGRDWVEAVLRQRIMIRWGIYLFLVFSIILCGVYVNDYQQKAFIYFNF